MNRVLVTGAAGFIGRQTLKPLTDSGFEVLALGHSTTLSDVRDVAWHTADLLEPSQPERLMAEFKPSHLLHFAWCMAPDYRTTADNLRWCEASIGLLRSFTKHGGKRAVLCGTCFEYDARYGYCSEHLTPSAPSTLYGVCKNGLREIALGFARRAEISLAWGRPFFLYGPNEAPARLVPTVITSLLNGEPAKCSHGEQVRDFLHVADVAGAFVALLMSKVTGTVNIASGVPVKLKDLIYRVSDKIGARQLVHLGAYPTPNDDPPLLVADVRCLRDEVGWRPSITLDKGLQDTVNWWRNIGLKRSQ